jgi:hypothetical protein
VNSNVINLLEFPNLKQKYLIIALLFTSTLAFSQRPSKKVEMPKLIGTWNSNYRGNPAGDSNSIYKYKDLNIEFLSLHSFRFILPSANSRSKVVYWYEIDSVNGFSIIKYREPKASIIFKMILFVMEDNTIGLVMVNQSELNDPLKSLDHNWHNYLTKKEGH